MSILGNNHGRIKLIKMNTLWIPEMEKGNKIKKNKKKTGGGD